MGTATLPEGPGANSGRVARIPWEGPLDVETVSALEAQVDPYLESACASLILDLSRADYIDSAGLRFLLKLRERLAEARDRLVLVVTGGSRVDRTMSLVGFDQLFAVVRRPMRAWREKRGK